MPLPDFEEQSRASSFVFIATTPHPSTENNLFLVKRLIQRTDMRNPDSGPKRYTSLAWASVLGHEETFEFLLTAGHDDEELSRVSNLCVVTLHFRVHTHTIRTQRVIRSLCFSPTSSHHHRIRTHPVHLKLTRWVLPFAWPGCTMTAIHGSLIGPILRERLRSTWQL